MARYIKDFYIAAPPQAIYNHLYQYLIKEGYEYIQFEGETVFKKGHGLMTGPTIFKFTFFNNVVRMETWMKYAVLPGVYISEMGLSGFVGAAAKGPWKARVKYIEGYLSMCAPNPMGAPQY